MGFKFSVIRAALSASWALCILSAPVAALATTVDDAPPHSVELRLNTAGCGDVAAVEREVSLRSQRISFVPQPTPLGEATGGAPLHQATHQVSVTVTSGEDQAELTATLHFNTKGTKPFVRSLSSNTCEELLAGIGFVIAITVDPPSGAEPALDDKAQPTSQPKPARPVGEAPVSNREAPQAPSLSARTRWLQNLGLGLQVEQGLAPAPLFGLSASWGLRAAPKSDSRWLGPGLDLSLAYSRSQALNEPGGVAQFALLNASLHACPVGLELSPLTVQPCALLSVGYAWVQGHETRESESHRRPWGLVGGGVIFSLPLSPSWRLAANGDLGAVLVQDQFQFEPAVFHRVPAWALRGSVGAITVF